MNEQKLIRALKQKKPTAYEQIMTQYGRLLWTIAAGIISGKGTREDVEEVVADVFVELWQHPEEFDCTRGTLRSFLCIKTKTRAINRLRKLCRSVTVPLETEPGIAVEDLQAALFQTETLAEIRQQLAQLGSPDSEIMTLRLLYELKPADIAAKLELPIAQVYERIRRGKHRLAAALRQGGYNE